MNILTCVSFLCYFLQLLLLIVKVEGKKNQTVVKLKLDGHPENIFQIFDSLIHSIVLSTSTSYSTFTINSLSYDSNTNLEVQHMNSSSSSDQFPFTLIIKISNATYAQSMLPKLCAGYLWQPLVIVLISPKTVNETLTYLYRDSIQNTSLQCFGLNSRLFIIEFNQMNQNLLIYELYSLKYLIHFNYLDTINLEICRINKIVCDLQWIAILDETFSRRRNLQGIKVLAVAQETEKFFYSAFFKESNGILSFDGGYDVDYFQILADALNITVVPIRGEGYISKDTNGQVTGMGQQLLQNKTDISITHSEYLIHRQKDLAYLQPHFVGRILAFFQRPRVNSLRDIYIQPLPINLRWVTVACWVLILICLYTTSVIIKKYARIPMDDAAFRYSHSRQLDEICTSEEEFEFDSEPDFVLMTFAIICQQGWSYRPKESPIMIIMITSLFFALLIYVAFSATIVSTLSILESPIKSFNDIIELNDMKIYISRFTLEPQEFLEKGKQNGQIMNIIDKSNRTRNGFGIISNEFSAFICMEDEFYLAIHFLYNTTQHSICNTLAQVPVSLNGKQMLSKAGMLVRKNEPLKEFFTIKQIRIQEAGIQYKLLKDHLYRAKPLCDIEFKEKTSQLCLEDLFTPFLIYGIGLANSIVVFLIEMLSERFQ